MIPLFVFSWEGCYKSVEKPHNKTRVLGGRCCGESGEIPAEMEEGQQEGFATFIPGSAANGNESPEEVTTLVLAEVWMVWDGWENPFPLLPNSCSGIYSGCSGISTGLGIYLLFTNQPQVGLNWWPKGERLCILLELLWAAEWVPHGSQDLIMVVENVWFLQWVSKQR